METSSSVVGTVISDQDSPTFEVVRVKLRFGYDIRPGMLVRIPASSDGTDSMLIGRIRSAYENNPNERPEDISVRDTLGLDRNYPGEEDSTTIYRLIEAELVEELVGGAVRAPQTLPGSGAEVSVATEDEIVQALGIAKEEAEGIELGTTASGADTKIVLKRDAIQRHLFVCGTTGSGKSYAMGVVTEELVEKHKLPVIFIDTQDEYSLLVEKLGGVIVEPGEDFSIRISSLEEAELIDQLPKAMRNSDLQVGVVTKAFGELKAELASEDIAKFKLEDVLERVPGATKALTSKEGDVPRVQDTVERRLKALQNNRIFGGGVADWRKLMYPCLAINCKRLNSSQLQSIATAVLRELQMLRLKGHIPPYVAVIDEAHLFVPEGEGSACKQIIREGVRIGRHHGISMVLMTQSPVDIDKRAIRQCNTRMVFALEPDQLDAIRGVKSDASEEMLRSLPKMPQGTCLLSGTYESIKHTIPVGIRERRTKDSEGGETPDIFEEMSETWEPKIAELKSK